MHSLLPTFQKRADLILQGQIDAAASGYVTPFWARIRGSFVYVSSPQALWEGLSHQHLSQMARGITQIVGELEDATRLTHGAIRATVHWREICDMTMANSARWFRTVYICRPEEDTFKTVGLTLTETRPLSVAVLPKVFAPPCEDW